MENSKIKSTINFYESFKIKVEEDGNKLITSKEEFIKLREKSKANNTISVKIKCWKCGENYNITCSNYSVSTKCCRKCSQGKKLTVKEIEQRINKKGLKLIKCDNYIGDTCKLVVECSCGNIITTTYASIRNSAKIYHCEKCEKDILRNKFKTNFKEIVEYFHDNGCILLSEESNFLNVKCKLKYIARCGHEHLSSYDSFKKSKYKLCKKCTDKIKSGKNACNWNGGYDNESAKFRKTYEFKKWHKYILARDNYTCRCCGNKGKNLNVHHLDGYNWCIEKRTDINNGITLCEACHNKFHDIYGKGNNTKEQFEEYLKKEKEKQVKKIFG